MNTCGLLNEEDEEAPAIRLGRWHYARASARHPTATDRHPLSTHSAHPEPSIFTLRELHPLLTLRTTRSDCTQDSQDGSAVGSYQPAEDCPQDKMMSRMTKNTKTGPFTKPFQFYNLLVCAATFSSPNKTPRVVNDTISHE